MSTPARVEAATSEEQLESPPAPAGSGFLRSSALVGSLTFVSRATGFVREILVAGAFGTSSGASALVLAQTVPNLSRSLASEDVAHGTLVPTVTDLRAEGRAAESRRLALLCGMWATAVLAVLMVVVFVAATLLVDVVSPGLHGAERDQTTHLLKVLAPVILFNGMLGAGSAMLVADGRFGVVGASAVASNLPVLAGLALVPSISVTQVAVLLVVGYALQAAVLGATAFGGQASRAQIRTPVNHERLRRDFRKVALLAPPIIVSLGMANLSGLVDMAFSSLVSVGAPAALDKAFRLVLLPYGVFAMAIGVVALPRLALAASGGGDFDSELLRATRLQAAVLIPLALGAGLMADPIVRVAYERGAFDAASRSLTADALIGVAFALPAMGLSLVGTRAWLSRKRPWFPAALATVGLGLNAALDAILIGPLGVAGIGVSTAVVHAGVGLTLIFTAARSRGAFARELGGFIARVGGLCALAALAAVLLAAGIATATSWLVGQWVAVPFGAAMFLALARRCGVPEFGDLLVAVKNRGGRAA